MAGTTGAQAGAAAERHAPDMPRRQALVRAGTIALALIVVFLAANHCASLICHCSDHALRLLVAEDMLKGNWNLHGWTLSPDNFWTLEPPLYGAGILIEGFAPALMHQVPALIFTFLLACAVWLVRIERPAPLVAGEILTFSLVGLLSAPWVNPGGDLPTIGGFPVPCVGPGIAAFSWEILTCQAHSVTLLGCLGVVILLAPLASSRPRVTSPLRLRLRLAAAVILMGLMFAGDPLADLVLALPLLAVSAVRTIRNGLSKLDAVVIAAVVGAFILAEVILFVLRVSGGFGSHMNIETHFASYPELFLNAKLAVHLLLQMFDADFFGREATQSLTLLILVRFAALIFVVYSVWITLRSLLNRATSDWISAVLAAGFVVSFAMGIFARGFYGYGMYYARILAPAVIFGSIVGGRVISGLLPARPMQARLALLSVLVASAFLSTSWLGMHKEKSPYVRLGEWLEAKGLNHGYGPFWDADIVTVETAQKVKMRPVTKRMGWIVPKVWWCPEKWYSESGTRTFLAWDDASARFDGLNLPETAVSWGAADETYDLGLFHVMVWNHDISLAR